MLDMLKLLAEDDFPILTENSPQRSAARKRYNPKFASQVQLKISLQVKIKAATILFTQASQRQ